MDTQVEKYTLLCNTVPDKKSKFFLAGVVIDATQPYKTSKTLIVSLKIVDPSVASSMDDPEMMDVDKEVDEELAIQNSKKIYRPISVFNYNKKEEMPLVKNVGDIILLRN